MTSGCRRYRAALENSRSQSAASRHPTSAAGAQSLPPQAVQSIERARHNRCPIGISPAVEPGQELKSLRSGRLHRARSNEVPSTQVAVPRGRTDTSPFLRPRGIRFERALRDIVHESKGFLSCWRKLGDEFTIIGNSSPEVLVPQSWQTRVVERRFVGLVPQRDDL